MENDDETSCHNEEEEDVFIEEEDVTVRRNVTS